MPASHPSFAAELMLRLKGIDYRRFDLVAGIHRPALRLLGFERMTVPAVRLDGARVQGTKEIALALDALRPDPPLLPGDPARREAVERAESWGDEVYQPVARRLVWAAVVREGSAIPSYLEGARLGFPVPLAVQLAPPVARLAAHLNHATEANVRRDLAALPGLFDRVDALLREGTIGGTVLNVADFQIGTTTALLATLDDLRPLLAGRPALEHARRVAPDTRGHAPSAFPPAWLQG